MVKTGAVATISSDARSILDPYCNAALIPGLSPPNNIIMPLLLAADGGVAAGDKNNDGGGDVTGKDWLFDFLLSVFKSPHWDVAVMGFIDENCAVFDKDEENKLSYTTLHHQFKDLVSHI